MLAFFYLDVLRFHRPFVHRSQRRCDAGHGVFLCWLKLATVPAKFFIMAFYPLYRHRKTVARISGNGWAIGSMGGHYLSIDCVADGGDDRWQFYLTLDDVDYRVVFLHFQQYPYFCISANLAM